MMSMGNIDIANAFTDALNAQQWDKLASLLTDDFTFSGATPQPADKNGFIAAQQQWAVGVPDWRVTQEEVREEGDTVRATSRISGTQTNTLTLPMMPPIPATGKHFSATMSATITVRGEMVASLSVVPGTPGILEQLGVQPPA
jgi:predicted ester cyclase